MSCRPIVADQPPRSSIVRMRCSPSVLPAAAPGHDSCPPRVPPLLNRAGSLRSATIAPHAVAEGCACESSSPAARASSGRTWSMPCSCAGTGRLARQPEHRLRRHLDAARQSDHFDAVECDLFDEPDRLADLVEGADAVVHLAANADVRFGWDAPTPRPRAERDRDPQRARGDPARRRAAIRCSPRPVRSTARPRSIPTPEDAPFPVQTSLYGASKAAAEGYIAAYAEAGLVSATVFRFVSCSGRATPTVTSSTSSGSCVDDPDAPDDPGRRTPAQELSGRRTTASRRHRRLHRRTSRSSRCSTSASTTTARSPSRPGGSASDSASSPSSSTPAATADGSATTRSSTSTPPRIRATGWEPALRDPGGGRDAPSTTSSNPGSRAAILATTIRYRDRRSSRHVFPLVPRREPSRSSIAPRRRRHRAVVEELRATRERGGRLFFCGSGGGAGHASHAACDFRKLARIESYCVTDNVSELTARINDDGWDSSYAEWLAVVAARRRDCLFVFSVGGGRRRPPRQRQPRAGHAPGAGGRCSIVGHRRPRRRRAAQERRRVRGDPDGRRRPRHPADRRAAGARLAPDGVAPGTRPETAKWESITDAAVQHAIHERHVIITRTPLRISLGGGGTDLPATTANGRRLPHRRGDHEVRLHRREPQLRRRRAAEVLAASSGSPSRADVAAPAAPRVPPAPPGSTRGVEISSMADIPAGTGLGSSGAFTVGVLQALHAHQHEHRVERRARRRRRATSRSTGSASRSGSRTSTSPRSAASPRSSSMPTTRSRSSRSSSRPTTRHRLEDNLLLFFTGVRRSASDVLADQQTRPTSAAPALVDNLDAVQGARLRDDGERWRRGDLDAVRRAAHRAVGAEVRAVAQRRCTTGRRVDPRRDRRRRGRRQARRRRRRRVPALLRRGQGRAARRDGGTSGSRRCASASTTTARPSSSPSDAARSPCSPAASAPGSRALTGGTLPKALCRWPAAVHRPQARRACGGAA